MTKQEWLLTQIKKFPKLSVRELVSKLNTKVLVDNPQQQRTIPLIPSLKEVLQLVTEEERFAISETKTYDRILSAINEQKFDWIVDNVINLKGGTNSKGEKILSEVSFDKLVSLLEKTQPDPKYQSQIYISEVELAGFDTVFVYEVEALG